MENIPEELFRIVCDFLNHKDNLIFYVCAKKSNRFLTNIDRRHHQIRLYYPLLYPYISPSMKNPIFTTFEDVEEIIEDFSDIESYDEKISNMFLYLSYYVKSILKDFNQPAFETIPLYFHSNISCSYSVKKFAVSSKRWGFVNDVSKIINKNVKVSGIYGIKAPSRNLRVLKKSLVLKALIG